MKILVLGDVMGPSGVKAIKERLPKIINDKKVPKNSLKYKNNPSLSKFNIT